ncbi:DUF4097 family beta strand repeat-containing protein [Streptomyces sp. NPDC101490]|uniref:DUF4097 family beta strand repeat-containing protein n=1 Tax=Streptomyces sp. NPDC101490 TaxID=3366143 RepID=UPI003808FA47
MQRFDTPTPVSLVLDIPAGDIRLVAADGADTTVEVRPADASKGRDVTAAERIVTEYRDGVLKVAAEPAKNPVRGDSGSVRVTVGLPAGSRVEARTAAATIRGVGRLGDVAVDGARGSLRFDETTSARLTLLAGDITVGRLGGPAEIETQQGGITVEEAVRGTVALRTAAGPISVAVAAGVSASLDAGTAHGRISNALRNADGSPTLEIRATTSHGDITARGL